MEATDTTEMMSALEASRQSTLGSDFQKVGMVPGAGMSCGEALSLQLPVSGELGKQICTYVCIFVPVEEEQDEDRRRRDIF